MDTLKILYIYDRLYLRTAKFMFKVYQRIEQYTPDYIPQQCTLRNNVNTSVSLRSATACCFIPPKHRTEHYKYSLRYSGCLVWNSLPDEIKRAESQNTFHNRCII